MARTTGVQRFRPVSAEENNERHCGSHLHNLRAVSALLLNSRSRARTWVEGDYDRNFPRLHNLVLQKFKLTYDVLEVLDKPLAHLSAQDGQDLESYLQTLLKDSSIDELAECLMSPHPIRGRTQLRNFTPYIHRIYSELCNSLIRHDTIVIEYARDDRESDRYGGAHALNDGTGLSLAGSAVGHYFILAAGSTLPLVLRPEESRVKLTGLAVIPGIMHGEAWKVYSRIEEGCTCPSEVQPCPGHWRYESTRFASTQAIQIV